MLYSKSPYLLSLSSFNNTIFSASHSLYVERTRYQDKKVAYIANIKLTYMPLIEFEDIYPLKRIPSLCY